MLMPGVDITPAIAMARGSVTFSTGSVRATRLEVGQAGG